MKLTEINPVSSESRKDRGKFGSTYLFGCILATSTSALEPEYGPTLAQFASLSGLVSFKRDSGIKFSAFVGSFSGLPAILSDISVTPACLGLSAYQAPAFSTISD